MGFSDGVGVKIGSASISWETLGDILRRSIQTFQTCVSMSRWHEDGKVITWDASLSRGIEGNTETALCTSKCFPSHTTQGMGDVRKGRRETPAARWSGLLRKQYLIHRYLKSDNGQGMLNMKRYIVCDVNVRSYRKCNHRMDYPERFDSAQVFEKHILFTVHLVRNILVRSVG